MEPNKEFRHYENKYLHIINGSSLLSTGKNNKMMKKLRLIILSEKPSVIIKVNNQKRIHNIYIYQVSFGDRTKLNVIALYRMFDSVQFALIFCEFDFV